MNKHIIGMTKGIAMLTMTILTMIRWLGRRIFQGLVYGGALYAGSAAALEPEHETRRLMLATEQAVAGESWGEAGEYLNRLQGLESEKPPEYLFYRGRVMLEADHYNEAKAALENYVDQTGSEGKNYKEALQMITTVEKEQQASSERAGKASGEEPVAVIESAGREPLDRLQQLYLTDSPAEALTLHLNSLLELNGWRQDPRIVRTGSAPDLLYRVSLQSGEINIQESRRTDNGEVRLSAQSLSVYGISPSVRWDCVAATQSCWVYDPRNDARLFRLAGDKKLTAEAAQTLGRLIKTTQAPN
ncbi:hypothetical protein [Marinobacter changyiensis]|uniref:hypothetical protein n=1 Tax=Marinobacter changyiensis TaxID=2604091 RepID=UPI001FE40FF0|nr:hypothetical protein [Marinobacter changyiensis]